MKKNFVLLIFPFFCFSQTINFDTFTSKKQFFDKTIPLSDNIHETSGLIKFNNQFITFNDDTDCNLYFLDTISGKIVNKVLLPKIKNNDWEEIQQDENYIYIGDFGNNASGNRTDLKIYSVLKETLFTNPEIDSITFSYKNQVNFIKQKPNNTNFDCEAFVVSENHFFLFSKEWKSRKTTLYKISKSQKNAILIPISSFNIKGLVTGVCYLESQNVLYLSGYTKKGRPFISVFYDFKNNNYFNGKHKKIKLKPRFQQIEAIFTQNGIDLYLTSEKLNFLLANRLQAFHYLKLN